MHTLQKKSLDFHVEYFYTHSSKILLIQQVSVSVQHTSFDGNSSKILTTQQGTLNWPSLTCAYNRNFEECNHPHSFNDLFLRVNSRSLHITFRQISQRDTWNWSECAFGGDFLIRVFKKTSLFPNWIELSRSCNKWMINEITLPEECFLSQIDQLLFFPVQIACDWMKVPECKNIWRQLISCHFIPSGQGELYLQGKAIPWSWCCKRNSLSTEHLLKEFLWFCCHNEKTALILRGREAYSQKLF